jgi:formate dehydrogenase major subunit
MRRSMGQFKGLYIQGEDILQSDPNTRHVAAGLAAMECVVVHDLFLNETANYAHVFLPGSTFLEKDGTFTNAERRINRVRKVMAPKNGLGRLGSDAGAGARNGRQMELRSPLEIMDEVAATTPSFAGVSYALLEREGSVQWPCNDKGADWHAASCMSAASCAARASSSSPTMWRPTKRPDPRFPLLLTTGRILSQYNVGAQTRRTQNTIWHQEDVSKSIRMMPSSAAFATVTGSDSPAAAGETTLRAEITDRVAPGVVYTTFHHPETGECHHDRLFRLGDQLSRNTR